MLKFEKEFRKEKPETIGETDKHFDLANYAEWLDAKFEKSNDCIKTLIDAIEFVSTEYNANYVIGMQDIELLKAALLH